MKYFAFPLLLSLCLVNGVCPPALAQNPGETSTLPTPGAGEIGLEGSVISVDAGQRGAVIAATRFFLPNGKNGPIAPPKNKIVSWDNTVLPTAKVQQLQVGATVRIIGKDLGSGKALPARIIAFMEKEIPAPPPKTPPQTPTQTENPTNPGQTTAAGFPLEVEDKGWKFRVLDAGFLPADSPVLTPELNNQNDNRDISRSPAFAARYAALNPKGQVMADWFQTESVQGVSFKSSTIRARVVSPAGVAYNAETLDNNVVSCPAVDPHWPFVWLELFGRDPQAADGLGNRAADGEFRQLATLDFTPPTTGNAVELNQTVKTPQGAQIKIKTIQLKRENQGGTLNFTYSITAQPDEFISDFDGPAIVDTRGNELQNGGSGGSDGDDYHSEVPLDTLPTDATWHARFSLVEVRRSQATAANRFLVRFKIPLTPPVARPPFAHDSIVTRVASPANALEALIEDDGSPTPFWWSGRLWVHNTGPDKSKFWTVKTAHFFLPNGKELENNADDNRRISYWHRDGSRAQGQDNDQQVTAFFADGTTRPATLKGRFELQSQHALDYAFTVKTAIPQPGQTLQPNADVVTDNNAPFVLRSVRYYQSLDELKGLTDQYQIMNAGLALVFEAKPLLTDSQLMIDAANGQAYDDAMRPLHSERGLRWMHVNVLTGEQGNFWTLLIPAPAADAKTVEVSTQAQEKTMPGPAITVEIPTIPIPPVPK